VVEMVVGVVGKMVQGVVQGGGRVEGGGEEGRVN